MFLHCTQVVFRGARVGLLLVCCGCLWGRLDAAVQFPLRWRWSNPLPHGNNVVGMAFTPNPFRVVQVAERGQIYTSDDLDLWTPRESGVTNALRSVTYLRVDGTNRIVITGESGLVLYADSVDHFLPGTLDTGPTDDWLESVTASAALAVSAGDNGAIYTSLNGISWKKQKSGTTAWLTGVTYGNGRFVAVGETGTILISTNGTNWTTANAGGATEDFNDVFYASGRFSALGSLGSVFSSTNSGANWFLDKVGAGNELFAGAANAGLYGSARALVGSNEVRLQMNGGAWTNTIGQATGPPSWTYYSALGRPDYFLIAGNSGLLVEGFKTNQVQPYLWLPTENSVRRLLFDVMHLPGLFVTVGDGATIMTSGDGVSWSQELPPRTMTNSIFLTIGGDTNLLISVGSQGSVIVSTNLYVTNYDVIGTNLDGTDMTMTNVTSTLGIFWNTNGPPFTTNDLQGICLFKGLYIVGADFGGIYTSPNAANWTKRTTPTVKTISSLASSPDLAIASGDKGLIITSTDGLTWTLRTTGTTDWIYRMRYLGGSWIGVGQNGTILTSSNGVNWTRQTSGTTHWLHDVTLIADTYFAVGKSGTVLTSSNRVTWTDRGTITGKSIYGCETDGEKLIGVGLEGLILRSPVVPVTTPVEILAFSRIASTNSPIVQNLFLIGGRTDQRFTLDSIPEFETGPWSIGPILELYDSSGTLLFLQTFAGTNQFSTEFYRTSLIP